MNKLITTTSMFAMLLATPVLAQTSEMPTNENSKPAIEQPSKPVHATPPVKDEAAMPAEHKSMSDTTAANPTSTQPAMVIGEQWRASKLIGQPVRNASNETVGDINDFVLASDGSIQHVLVGVGGFLGLGEKVVALKFDELTFTKGSDGKYLISTTATKKTLESASGWKNDAAN